MKGIELSKLFFTNFGDQLFKTEASKIYNRLAFGIAGEGSECFGFDDEISTDHDFDIGFCVWVSSKDYEEFGLDLQRVYSKLPKEFNGFNRQIISPVGGKRHGIILIDDFYNRFLGLKKAPTELEHWLSIPHETLATACNGEVFCDNLGEFTAIRNELLKGYPTDVKLKKLAAHAIMLVQSGLYNYERCIKHNEPGAAQLCVFEFVKHTVSIIYLLNNVYEPFYKWAYRGMRNLSRLAFLENALVSLTTMANSEQEAAAKEESMKEISCVIVEELRKQDLVSSASNDLEKQAYALQNKIKNHNLRNMHIMEGI